jgi:hypothetical protein
MRVLYIGNSYTTRNDLPRLVALLAAEVGQQLDWEVIAAGGASLRRHWNAGAGDRIAEGVWDLVVLQEQSTLPLKNGARFHENVREFAAVTAAAAVPLALYQTWARADAPEAQVGLSAAYADIAGEVGAAMVPVGDAWARCLAAAPELVLHTADNSHPTLAGSWLGALVFGRVLLGAAPPAQSPDADVSPDDWSVLLRVAAP